MPAKIYRSPFPDIDLPRVDLISFLFSNPYKVPLDKPIYVDALSTESYSYQQVVQRTKSLAHGFRSLGVRPDDIVALLSPNSIDYGIICYAVIGCGAAVSPVNSALTPGEVHSQLKTSGAKYIVVHSSLLESARKAIQGTAVQCIIQADEQSNLSHGLPTVPNLSTTCPPTELISTDPALLDKRPAFICFSSGTTGAAKGVVTTHANMTANILQWQRVYFHETPPSATGVSFLPLSHIYGINVFLCGGIFRGITMAILARFDLDVYLGCIQKYRPDDLYLVPPIALLLVKNDNVQNYDLGSVKRILSAAAPLSAELAAALEEAFKTRYGTTVHCHQSWGLTETSPLAAGVPPAGMGRKKTVGCIAPNMEFRFVDPETLQDVVETDANGTLKSAEVICRGPNVTQGYFNNEAATKEAFHTDEQGLRWFRTGDIATIDKEGYIVIHDRIKEMIKYKGLQVIPSELEGKLLEHSDVQDCAVTSVWDPSQATELPLAFIVLGPNARNEPSEIVIERINRWLNQRIANHKRLRGGIRLVDSIPKNPSGKILRRKLKEKETLLAKVPSSRL